jgi:hypothetical protein
VSGVEPGVVVEAVEELGLDVADEGGEVLRGVSLADTAGEPEGARMEFSRSQGRHVDRRYDAQIPSWRSDS